MKKKILIISTIISVIIMNISVSFASFADFDDEAARQETEKMLEEQEKDLQQSANKSNNNYLSSLSIENYKLTPKFDKQIQEYKVEGKVEAKKITVNAILEDSRATVTGTGTVELQEGKNTLRIDVTSQRGSIRTYIININTDDETIDTSNMNTDNEDEKENSENNNINEAQNNNTNSNKIMYISIIIIAILVIVVLKKKSRRVKQKIS